MALAALGHEKETESPGEKLAGETETTGTAGLLNKVADAVLLEALQPALLQALTQPFTLLFKPAVDTAWLVAAPTDIYEAEPLSRE